MSHLLTPHSHDASDSVDAALESSAVGIRAVKISLVVLGITAIAQAVVVALSGSVALAADTIHNFSDALTAVPLWVAFVLSTRAATKRYTYGFGRAEDLAGLFVVAMIALSAVIAGYEAVIRLINPVPIEHVGWVAAAGLIGFIGNELVALHRIRVGRRIGSAALVADGLHARTDGFTSLAVLVSAGGVALGFPLADPIVGIVITFAILAVLRTAARDVFRRLMDASIRNSSRRRKARWRRGLASSRYAVCGCAGSAIACTPTLQSRSIRAPPSRRPTASPTMPNTGCSMWCRSWHRPRSTAPPVGPGSTFPVLPLPPIGLDFGPNW